MKKILPIVLVSVVLLFAGCGKKSNSASSTRTSVSGAAESLLQIVNNGKSKHCSKSISAANGSLANDVYTDGKGKAHATFTAKAGTEVILTNVLFKDSKEYIWYDNGSGKDVGIVFDPNKIDISKDDLLKGIGTYEKMSLDCNSSSVDSSKFDLPAGVTFTAFTTTNFSSSASIISSSSEAID